VLLEIRVHPLENVADGAKEAVETIKGIKIKAIFMVAESPYGSKKRLQ
jgi:hypothetical protein